MQRIKEIFKYQDTCVCDSGGALLAHRALSHAPVSKFHIETSLLPSNEQVTQDGFELNNGAADNLRTLAPIHNKNILHYIIIVFSYEIELCVTYTSSKVNIYL